MKHKLTLLIVFSLFITITTNITAQKYKNRNFKSFEMGLIMNSDVNEKVLNQFGLSVGFNINKIHLDASLNTLENYGKERLKYAVGESTRKKQFTTVNIGYNLSLYDNFKGKIYIVPKVGLYYQCYINDYEDVYTIEEEKYMPNFDVDIAIYLRNFRGIGIVLTVASSSYDYGIRIAKSF